MAFPIIPIHRFPFLCTQYDALPPKHVADTSHSAYNQSVILLETCIMPDGKRPKPQHAPKAPHEDLKFMSSTPARPIRILAEYIHPLAELKKQGISDTIVMFGSARIDSRESAAARCTHLKETRTAKWSAVRQ